MPANRCPNPDCEYFNRALPNNAKVCPWCLTPLGNVISAAPENPPQQQPPPQPYQQPPYVPTTPQQPPELRLPVLKLIHSNGREFSLYTESGSIGRHTQSKPIPPEIDLCGIPDEGVVSRRHARVYWDWSQNTYMIVDISKNGTYLNGNLLNSNVPYPLLNGNELQLGQDNLVVFKVSIL